MHLQYFAGSDSPSYTTTIEPGATYSCFNGPRDCDGDDGDDAEDHDNDDDAAALKVESYPYNFCSPSGHFQRSLQKGQDGKDENFIISKKTPAEDIIVLKMLQREVFVSSAICSKVQKRHFLLQFAHFCRDVCTFQQKNETEKQDPADFMTQCKMEVRIWSGKTHISKWPKSG